MKRTLILTIAVLMTLGLLAGGVLAQGQGRGHGPPPFAAAEVVIKSVTGHGPTVSPGFANDDNIVASLELGDGDWKITATGAIQVALSAEAPNCGLRLDDDSGSAIIGKQNFADSNFVGRSGFAVTGHAEVAGEAEVHLVCYGAGGNAPFEFNLVAVGGE